MPTKEQILEAAATIPEAKQALEKLFPEYFDNRVLLDDVYAKQYPYALSLRLNESDLLTVYKDCQNYKGIVLSSNYKWELVDDRILIPTKK